MSRAPELRQSWRRSTSAMKRRSSRWVREAWRCDPSTASISSSSLYPSAGDTRTSLGHGGGPHTISNICSGCQAPPSRLRSLLGISGRCGFFRCALFHIEPLGVRRLQPRAFDLVAAREVLDLTTRRLLLAEVDRDQRAFAADGTGGRSRI